MGVWEFVSQRAREAHHLSTTKLAHQSPFLARNIVSLSVLWSKNARGARDSACISDTGLRDQGLLALRPDSYLDGAVPYSSVVQTPETSLVPISCK